MTTIKEYKAMIEGATDAPLEYYIPAHSDVNEVNECGVNYWEITPEKHYMCANYLNITGWMKEQTAARLALSYNIAPELIRVIELAEEALNYALSQMQPFCSNAKVTDALSEIKKLKGDA